MNIKGKKEKNICSVKEQKVLSLHFCEMRLNSGMD